MAKQMQDNYFQFNVFISYSHADKNTAELIAKLLSDIGLKVWIDSWGLVPGQAWQESIKTALDSSQNIIFLIGEKRAITMCLLLEKSME